MYLILAAIMVGAVMSAALLIYGDEGFQGRHLFASIIGFLLAIATGVTALVYAALVWEWIASDHRAQIINREYGTNYTREEVFYASKVIETIRQLDRKRYEINGDMMRDKK